jgi:hypothetical protein
VGKPREIWVLRDQAEQRPERGNKANGSHGK